MPKTTRSWSIKQAGSFPISPLLMAAKQSTSTNRQASGRNLPTTTAGRSSTAMTLLETCLRLKFLTPKANRFRAKNSPSMTLTKWLNVCSLTEQKRVSSMTQTETLPNTPRMALSRSLNMTSLTALLRSLPQAESVWHILIPRESVPSWNSTSTAAFWRQI